MKLYGNETKPICIELWRSKVDCEIACTELGKHEINDIGDDWMITTLCIIYPKGKRPDLGYSVNNKKEENEKTIDLL